MQGSRTAVKRQCTDGERAVERQWLTGPWNPCGTRKLVCGRWLPIDTHHGFPEATPSLMRAKPSFSDKCSSVSWWTDASVTPQ